MNRDRTIIYVANTSWYLYNFRLSLMRRMKGDGWRVIAVAPQDKYSSRIEGHGISYIPLKLSRKGMNPFKDLLLFLRLYKIYKTHSPSIAHHFTIKPMIYGSIAARIANVTAIVNAATGLGYVFSAKGIKARILKTGITLAYRIIFKGNNLKVIFQNPDDMDTFISTGTLSAGKAALIRGSGVDIRRFKPISEPEGLPVVLLCARMLWDKGVDDFVEATKILREKGVAINAILAGGLDHGNPSSISEGEIRGWEKEGLVRWLGHVEDMTDIYPKVNIVALPSTYGEGVPRSLIEAASSGRPLVATDVPGCREIVLDGKNGFLVPAKNPSALAVAICKLVEDPKLRALMGECSREIAETGFSEDKVIDDTIQVYKELALMQS